MRLFELCHSISTSLNSIPSREFLTYAAMVLAAVAAFLFVSTTLAGSAQHHDRPGFPLGLGGHAAPRPTSGAVSSGDVACSEIGLNMLKKGGSAADAAIAMQFCLGVKLPDLTGIGGGGFALVRSKKGKYSFVDFRERAPGAATEDMYTGRVEDSLMGGLAVAVPGEVRGMQHLHSKYGVLPWKTLIEPSVELATKGFKVGTYLDKILTTLDTSKFLLQEPWATEFALNGSLVSIGDILKRERLGRTLCKIANEGPDTFYKGSLAEELVREVKKQRGILTLADLEGYTITLRPPVEINYRGYRVVGSGAPSGGPVVLSTLKIIEGYNDMGNVQAINLSTHRLDEAFRFAYGQRTELGDPEYVPGLTAYQAAMVANETAHAIRDRISDETTLPVEAYNPKNMDILPTPGTSHLVAADRHGLVISLTSTINTAFGSRIMLPESGIILNNEMNDFSIPGSPNFFGFEPSPNNFIRPGKRPQSSMSPIIVEHVATGMPYLALGGAGGSRIISAVTQVLWYVLDWNKNCTGALHTPRLHDQLQPNQIRFEYSYDNSTVADMASKGHNVTWTPRIAAVHMLRKLLSDGSFEAASDPDQEEGGGLVS